MAIMSSHVSLILYIFCLGISMPQPRQCLSQSRLAVAQGMLRKASDTLNRLENPTATTSSSSPQESSSDISPDPNANTNV